MALAALAVIALLALAVREIVGLLRIRAHHRPSTPAPSTAVAGDDRDAARRGRPTSSIGLYASRPETARGRAALARPRRRDHRRARPDRPRRDRAAAAARRSGTAHGSRLGEARRAGHRDLAARAGRRALRRRSEILRLIRRLATLYDGRPGTLGFLRLTRAAITHLAVTGGIAAGDSLVQQILGHGIAARLSARLGEGVVNGLLTARVGIAAIEVCRPLPFVNGRPPRLADVMAELRRLGDR